MPVVRQQGEGWWYSEIVPEQKDGDEDPLFDLSILCVLMSVFVPFCREPRPLSSCLA